MGTEEGAGVMPVSSSRGFLAGPRAWPPAAFCPEWPLRRHSIEGLAEDRPKRASFQIQSESRKFRTRRFSLGACFANNVPSA
jgi:hypothetical protein